MQRMHRAASALSVAALLAAACSSENVTNAAPSTGGSGGTGGGVTGGTGGVATGGAGGVVAGGTGGSTGGDSGVDAASNPCAFQGDASVIGKWPDSKTKWCRGSCVGAGQDGDYEINPPKYKVSGSVVKDEVTGLEWRKDVISGKQWGEAGTACSALNTGDAGGGPWRLPTRFELISLLDFGAAGSFQPGELDVPTGPFQFWTSSEFVGNSALAWAVSFFVGSVSGHPKAGTTSNLSVRCVRGTGPASKLEANPSCEVVSDVGLGLQWYRPAESAQYTWLDALGHCQGLTHAGFDDWRLPSAKELMTIVDESSTQPALDTSVFGSTPGAVFWSSTPNPSDSTKSQVVDFDKGLQYADASSVAYRARCVRSLP